MVDDMSIDIDCANAQDHVGATKQNNETLMPSFGIVHHQCGHNTMPKPMIIALEENGADNLNVFLAQQRFLSTTVQKQL